MINLLPYQVAPAEQTFANLRARGASIDASDMGTGKTYMAAWVAEQLVLPVLVICPLSVKGAWEDVLSGTDLNYRIINYESLLYRTKRHKEFGEWRVTYRKNKPTHHWSWDLPTEHLIIFDEAHRAKGVKSQMGAMMRALGHRTLMLSATIASNPLEMKSVGVQLGLFEESGHRAWCRKHGCIPSPFNQWALEWPVGDARVGSKRLSQITTARESMLQLHRLLFQGSMPRGVRLLKSEIKDFPANQMVAELVYPEWKDKSLKALIDAIKPEEAISDLEHRIRLRQLAELSKLEMFASWTDDAVEQGLSVVIFTNFVASLEWLRGRFPDASWIAGGQPEADRKHQMHRFQDNDSHVIICQIQAGGLGISLHDIHGKRARVTLMGPTEKAVDMIQALGRTPRAGGRSHCYQRIVFAAGTIEEKIFDQVRDKISNIDRLNDGDLSFAAELKTNQEKPVMGTSAERMQLLATQAGTKKKSRKARTTRISFICHCGAACSGGDQFFTVPDGEKLANKPERFCSAKCADKYEGALAAEVDPADTSVYADSYEDLVTRAWSRNPWANSKSESITANEVIQLVSIVAGPQEHKWILDTLVECFGVDPYAEGNPQWTWIDICQFIDVIRPGPAEAPVPEAPYGIIAGTPTEFEEGISRIVYWYKGEWLPATYDAYHKTAGKGFYVKPDSHSRRTLIDAETHFHRIPDAVVEAPVQGDFEYPVEVPKKGTPCADDLPQPQGGDAHPLNHAGLSPEAVPEVAVPEQGAHHNYGPSSMIYREICCGYDGNDNENEASIRGTLCHHACEQSPDFEKFEKRFVYEGKEQELDHWEVQNVRDALEGVNQVIDYTVEEFGLKGQLLGIEKEVRLQIADLTYGTADIMFTYPELVVVVDYKFGWGKVPPAELNPQGLAYAIGALEASAAAKTCRVVFIQPKLGSISFHDYEREEILSTGIDRLAVVISKAKAYRAGQVDHSELKRTEYCRFCKHIGVCPAVNQAALTVGAKYVEELELPALADPGSWTTGEQFAAGLALSKVLEDWVPAVRTAARDFVLEKGAPIPGYKTQERKTTRKLKKLALIFDVVQRRYGVDLLTFLEAASMSVGDLENMVGATAEKGGKAKMVKELKSVLGEEALVEGGDSSFTILVKSRN